MIYDRRGSELSWDFDVHVANEADSLLALLSLRHKNDLIAFFPCLHHKGLTRENVTCESDTDLFKRFRSFLEEMLLYSLYRDALSA